MDSFKIQSRNVDGLGDNVEGRKLFQLLLNCEEEIFLLQETHSSIELENLWRSEWPGTIFFCHGTTKSRGTAIFFKETFS